MHKPSGKKNRYNASDLKRLNWKFPDINIPDIVRRIEAKQGFSSFPALVTLDPAILRQLNQTQGLNFKEAHKAAKEAQSVLVGAVNMSKGLEIWRKLEKVWVNSKSCRTSNRK